MEEGRGFVGRTVKGGRQGREILSKRQRKEAAGRETERKGRIKRRVEGGMRGEGKQAGRRRQRGKRDVDVQKGSTARLTESVLLCRLILSIHAKTSMSVRLRMSICTFACPCAFV